MNTFNTLILFANFFSVGSKLKMSSETKPPVVGNHGRMKKLAACSINAMTQYKLGWQVKYGSMKNIKRLTTVFLVPWKLA